MTKSIPYPDEPLPEEKSIIRLLRIDRKTKSSIVGELKRFSLDSNQYPPFTTISHVWGQHKADERVGIIVNGAEFRVTPNVFSILELARNHPDFKEVEWIWIDSICINQQDSVEKSAQVAIMGRIYRKSEVTAVWLGKAEKETNAAMDFLSGMVRRKPALKKKYRATNKRQTPSDLRDPEKWKPLRSFFELPWWKRVWTLQEFIIPRKLKFYWGHRSIDRSELKGALYAIWLCDPFDRLLEEDIFWPAWYRRRMHSWYAHKKKVGEKSLLAWLSYNSNAKVTDDRDRIYGVLGLVRGEDSKLVGKPKYGSENAVDLYRRLVTSWVQGFKSLDIICFAQLFNSRKFEKLENGGSLPSWVPDWRAPLDTFVVPLLVSQSGNSDIDNFRPVDADNHSAVYAASGTEVPRIRSFEIFDQLPCEGIRVDTIDQLSDMPTAQGPPNASLVQSASPEDRGPRGRFAYLQEPAASTELLNDVVRCLVLDRKDRYLSTPAPVEQFREQFQLLAASNSPPSEFAQWFQRNKKFRIKGNTLEELCKQLPMPKAEMEMGRDERNFLSRMLDTTQPKKMNRRLVTTSRGHLGMAPPEAKNGDVVCVLFGCSVPVVLRKRHDLGWEFIGECYLHGYMNGEILGSGRPVEEFILS